MTRAVDYFDISDQIGRLTDGSGMPSYLIMNYSRDIRYPPEEGDRLAAALKAAGARANAITLDSPIAHGGFLIEQASVERPIADFIRSLETS